MTGSGSNVVAMRRLLHRTAAAAGALVSLTAVLAAQAGRLVAPGVAAAAAPGAALFRQAANAARAAPAPMDSFLSDYVGTLELRAYPESALAVFAHLFEAAESLAAPEAGPSSQPLYYARFDLQFDAIDAFALEHKWNRALALARRFVPGPSYVMASAYDPIVMQMSFSKGFALGSATAWECYRSDGSFPYTGARSLILGGRLSASDSDQLAELGLHVAAADRPPPDSAARFLAAVLQALPGLKDQIESAAVSMLGNLHSTGTAANQRFTNETGARILAVLRAVDPERAEEESRENPSFASVFPRPRLNLQLAPGARGYALVPATSGNMQADPAAALAAVTTIQDKTDRFMALVQLAQSLAGKHPTQAAQAASSALVLLDKHMLAEEPLAAARLADVFRAIHDQGDAESVVESCLDALGARAQRIRDRFTGLSPLQLAEKWDALKVSAEPLLLTYFYASRIDARLVVARANAIAFAPLAIMAQAAVAAGEAGEPDIRNVTSLVGGRG